MKTVRVTICKCQRCGHIWPAQKKGKLSDFDGVTISAKTDINVCPKCKSPYWDKPR